MPKTILRPATLSFQPRPTFPYSPGTKGGQMIFTAGQVAWNKKGEVTGQDDVRLQVNTEMLVWAGRTKLRGVKWSLA
jgi:enamine deaminase RidA (YjgF/YER057c/UK114 family)